MKTAKQFQNELNVLRKEIHNTTLDCIKRLLQDNNAEEIECTECDSTPVIVQSTNEDDIATLDIIRMVGEEIVLEYSNSYECDEMFASNLSTDLLLNLYNWLEDNKDYVEFN